MISIQTNGKRLWLTSTLITIIIVLFTLTPSSLVAQDTVSELPEITSFERARFRAVSTIDLSDDSRGLPDIYRQGRLVLPDRGVEWTHVPGNREDTTGIVRIGTQTYVTIDDQWVMEDLGSYQSLAFEISFDMVNQLEQLMTRANTIMRVGQVDIAGVPTTQYQFWVPELAVFEARGQSIPEAGTEMRVGIDNTAYKYDVWIGPEGRVHQQNIVQMRKATTATLSSGEQITMDESEITHLFTYYDFDDPSITVDAPVD